MNHLLVIRLSALGDVAIMAPVVKAVAQANPTLLFTVAAPPLLQPLFDGQENLHFLGVKKQQPARDIYRQLRSVGADAVADLHQVNRVGHALLMLRLDALLHLRPLKVRRIRKGRFSRWLFLHHLRTKPRRPQFQRYLDVFRRLGLSTAQQPTSFHSLSLPFTPFHSPINQQSAAIGIAPFAQHRGKIWPFENTARLALLLAERGHHVLLFGSAEEAPQLEALETTLNSSLKPGEGYVKSLAGKQSFTEELEIIKGLGLMVSMDSSNMHFASVLGIPVVSIWGATHPDFGLYGFGQPRQNALCANLPCQPCSAFGQRPCRFGDYRCLHAITPEAVLQKIEEVLRSK